MNFLLDDHSIKTKLGLWLRGFGNLFNTCLRASGETVCRAPGAPYHKHLAWRNPLAWNFAQLSWSQKTCLSTLRQGLSNRP